MNFMLFFLGLYELFAIVVAHYIVINYESLLRNIAYGKLEEQAT